MMRTTLWIFPVTAMALAIPVVRLGANVNLGITSNLHTSSILTNGWGNATPYLAAQPRAGLNDAAYRDGLYEGRRDAEQGREAHITKGRWSQIQDRVEFSNAYSQAYESASTDR